MNSIEPAATAPVAEPAPDAAKWLLGKAPIVLDWAISSSLVATIIVGTTWVFFFAK